ncbi:MAG: hypothetical protein ACI82S_002836, partial [Patiriisocius sp.]
HANSTAGNCPFLPYNDDFETSAFFSNTNNIKAKKSVIGTFQPFE